MGPDIDSWSEFHPLGVVVGITPFNFPAMVPLWMYPLAIVCGNTFVLKPSERDPTAALLVAELLYDAGLPPGVLNIVNGDKEAVDGLLRHEQVQAVSLSSSQRADGQYGLARLKVYAAQRAKGSEKTRLYDAAIKQVKDFLLKNPNHPRRGAALSCLRGRCNCLLWFSLAW